MWEFVPCIDHPAAESFEAIDVRFGSLADIRASPRDVRSTPESRHWPARLECRLSANRRLLSDERGRQGRRPLIPVQPTLFKLGRDAREGRV